jgi:hypothetical protein
MLVLSLYATGKSKPSVTLSVGDKNPPQISYYVRVGTEDSVYLIPKYQVTDLVKLVVAIQPRINTNEHE